MAKHYRPFTLARAGELAALARVTASHRLAMTPVLRLPPVAWDFDKGGPSKTETAHIDAVLKRLGPVWNGSRAYIDLSLFASDAPVHGVHPLRHIVATAATEGVTLIPLLRADSSPALVSEAASLANNGLGIHLEQDAWVSVDPTQLPALLRSLRTTPADVDIFVDYQQGTGAIVRVAVDAELAALGVVGSFRSVTVGGSAFPQLTGVAHGTSEFEREDWLTYEDIRSRLADRGGATPDFLDHVIQNPDLIDQQIDPRVLSISATFRYTVDEKWLVAKGHLFKGSKTPRPGIPTGGAALINPLRVLQTHPEYATPVRSQADDWIDAVVAGTDSPGAPQKWREWGTVRHFEVTLHQLASRV